ncbi:MAG: DUF4445 domain-containing protein [Chloroflexi bacterium]|nr:DUF4445 domain-containing protein [Chloroflexota bacterium]
MREYKVTFLPDRKEVKVEEGTTLFDAAEKAEVYINSMCGGQGLCGECRLQVLSGNAKADKYAIGFFSVEEIQKGYVLACQTKVEDNLEVMVPARSRLEMEKIITEGTLAYSEPEKVSVHRTSRQPMYPFEPPVTKVYLELPPPTMKDNISDIDRITRELKKKLAFSSFEISLGCLQNLSDNLRQHQWKVTATVARHDSIGRLLQIEGGDTSEQNYGLAIDIGTTTVVVQLVHLKTGKVLGVEASHNLQARYGEDVISRMVFACTRGSLKTLNEAVVANINALTRALARENGVKLEDINCAVCAGNTTMSHFLLNLTPCSIRMEPYVPTAAIYPQILAREIGININPNGAVEIMPSVASYMGGDIVAGILTCGLADRTEVTCLIDVGTNGEIAVGNNEWIVCCSASAGPAFEGGGIKWGMHATRGAIEKIEIKDGQVTYKTISKSKPRGICGSGLIDVIYELARNRIIDQDGKFNPITSNERIVTGDGDTEFILVYPEQTETGQAVTIAETDISNLIKSKGAVFAALKSLMDYIGMSFNQLEAIYLAGGFGSSLDARKAIAIGLLPDIDLHKIHFIGNSSVAGARMALLSSAAFEAAKSISRRMTNIELSNYPPFMSEFIAALFLPHTDSKLFPSVHY